MDQKGTTMRLLKSLSPLIFGCVCAMLLFTILPFKWSLSEAKTTGLLDFAELSHHFGKVRVGDTKSWKFGFWNRSPNAIEIKSVTASCACVSELHWPRDAILSGDMGEIDVKVNYRQSVPAVLKSWLFVDCGSVHEAKNERVELSVVAEVCEDVILAPRELRFVDDGREEPKQELTVVRDFLDSRQFAGLRLNTPPWINNRETKRDTDRIVFQLTLNRSQVFNSGSSVSVEYGDKADRRRLAIPAAFVQTVRLVPCSYFVVVSDSEHSDVGDATRQRIELISSKYNAIKITGVAGDENLIAKRPDGSRITFWLTSLPKRRPYSSVLTVSYTAEYEQKPIQGYVRIPVRVIDQR